MFTKLKEAVTDEAVLALITEAEGKVGTIRTELESNEKKLIDAIASRDKYKDFTKTVKSKLKIGEDINLSEETIKDSLNALNINSNKKSSENEDILKQEIKNLEDTVKRNEDIFLGKIKEGKDELFKVQFDNRSQSAMKGMKLVNDKAFDMIHQELISGASFDNEAGDFVYKNTDGTVVRNTDGTVLTVEQKVSSIKESDDFSFLFSAGDNSGSGTGQSAGEGSGNMSEYDKYMASL